MRRPVTLPVFFTNEYTHELVEIGLKYKLTDCDVRRVDFYSIAAIVPYFETQCDERSGSRNDDMYTSIFSSDQEFVCMLPPAEVRRRIADAARPPFFNWIRSMIRVFVRTITPK